MIDAPANCAVLQNQYIFRLKTYINVTVGVAGLTELADVPSCQLGGSPEPCGFEDSFENPTASVKDIYHKFNKLC